MSLASQPNEAEIASWSGLSGARPWLAGGLFLACACGATPPSPDEAPALKPDAVAEIPDPLLFADGQRRVGSATDWPARRAEILEVFRGQVYGRAPGPPAQLDFTVLEEDPNAMGGRATLRRVAIRSRQAGREHTFELVRFAPNARARAGVFLLLNHRPESNTDPTRVETSPFWPAEEVIARGYAIAAIQTNALAPEDAATYTSGVIRLFEGEAPAPRPPDAWKMISAWSWGASRALDYLVTDPAVDGARVAVLGHSRGGKAALWAGAQDERFSLTISNDSGCAGAALSRRPVGETVAGVNFVFPYWFADNFRQYGGNEAALPVDQHELIALLAPRAVAVGSASNDEWSDPVGEFLGLAYASPVYALWGNAPIGDNALPAAGQALFVGPRGYHVRVGDHGMTEVDWRRYMDVADRVWPR